MPICTNDLYSTCNNQGNIHRQVYIESLLLIFYKLT
jgi:hypothetical protein